VLENVQNEEKEEGSNWLGFFRNQKRKAARIYRSEKKEETTTPTSAENNVGFDTCNEIAVNETQETKEKALVVVLLVIIIFLVLLTIAIAIIAFRYGLVKFCSLFPSNLFFQ
jgi:hypothetical protein